MCWNYQKMFDENLKERLVNTYKFSNYDINNFILLLRTKCFLKYMNLILLFFLLHTSISMASNLKKDQSKIRFIN